MQFPGFIRSLPLILVMVKNYRTILAAHICSLAVEGCRIMGFPESIQQLFIGYLIRVEFNLNYLGMSGFSCTDLLIGWID